MTRVFKALLVVASLLLLACLAARANSAPWEATEPALRTTAVDPAIPARPHLLQGHRCPGPGPQPGTHFQGQPFAYGYFGAKAQPTDAFHRSASGDWFQWSIPRAD
jgi:hypothetical protein